ncbi:MAG: PD40 domain-containing protein [Betaproteobacteria bacterium]|nr:PD40 domain-containing protein [Betaproteobacteria bacterium]
MMPFRYSLMLVGAVLLAGCGGGTDPAQPGANVAPPSVGPHVLVFDSDRTGSYQIFSMHTDGSNVSQLSSDPNADSWWPQLSPDRARILFYRAPKGVHDTDYSKASLWVMNVDGSDLSELRPVGTDGWSIQEHAEWSPDGSRLVMAGGTTTLQIYVTDTSGKNPSRITDGSGYWLDPSWSPDGKRLAIVGCTFTPCQPSDYEVYTVAANGSGGLVRVSSDALPDYDPSYSPDGTRIAWLTETQPPSATFPAGVWNIRIAGLDGSGLGYVTNDDEINSKPDWSTDGNVIYFHRFVYGETHWQIYSVQADGAGLSLIGGGQPGNDEYPDE